MWTNFDPSPSSSWPGGNNLTGGPVTGHIFASIMLDKQLTADTSSAMTPDVLNRFKQLGNQSLTVSPNSGGTDVSIQGNFRSAQEHRDVSVKAERATDEISQQLRETLWNQYITEGKKVGMWKDAIPAPGSPAPPVVAVQIEPEYRTKIKSYVREHKDRPIATKERIVVGAKVPSEVELQAVPSDWGPALSKYRYVFSGDRVMLVDPGTRTVVQEVD